MGQWGSWAEFWDMGGRAWYVWGSYGVTVLCIIAELWSIKIRRSSTIKRLIRLQRLRHSSNSPQSESEAT